MAREKTRHLLTFLNRAAHFDADLELADILRINIRRISSTESPYIFIGVDPEKHPRLAGRKKANPQSRSIAVNHLKATLYSSFLKDLYEDVTHYLRDILEAAASRGLDPGRLIGEHKVTFDGNQILTAGNWLAIVRLVTDSVFRKLENERDTKKLIQKIDSKLSLGLDAALVDRALPYLEIRHLLVHSDGKADAKFCDSYPDFGASPGRKIKLDHSRIQEARSAVRDLVEEIDRKFVETGLAGN